MLCVLCSLCRSMKTGRATPTDGSAESTVLADVERMELNGTYVRVYDCAGQVFHGYGTKWFGFCVVVVLGVACRLGLRCLPDHCRMSKIYLAGILVWNSASFGWSAGNTFSPSISRCAAFLF